MRSWTMALVVGLVASLLISRAMAGPPAPRIIVTKPTKDVIAALKSSKAAPKLDLSLVRFLGEALSVKTVETFPSNPLTSGLAGQQIFGAFEQRACGPLTEAELKAATAIVAEYGDVLPAHLRAFTLGQQGQPVAAMKLFEQWLLEQSPEGPCPSEHPDTGYARVRALSIVVKCAAVLAPKQKQDKAAAALERARECQANNHAVG